MNRLIYLTIYFLICAPVLYAQVSPALKITASPRNVDEYFGTSTAIDGQFAVVGASQSDDPDEIGIGTGVAYVFERNAAGVWNQIQVLAPADLQPTSLFGAYVAISGNYIAVSAIMADSIGPNDTIKDAGAVYIFERAPSGIWQQVIKITAPDVRDWDYFGRIALGGKYLVVGSSNDYDSDGNNYKGSAGAVYVFERTDGGEWFFVQKLTASDRDTGYIFSNVAIDAYTKTIVVGSPWFFAPGANPIPYAGAVYVFKRDAAGHWNETQKLTASAPHQQAFFGSSVSIRGSWILIGSDGDHYEENETYNLNNTGSAYLFQDNGAGSWSQVRKIKAHDGRYNDRFGQSVSIDGNYALIGSKGGVNEDGGNLLSLAGSAYLYERNGINWTLKKKLVAPDRSLHDHFGRSVSLSGAQMIIGASHEAPDPNGENTLRYGAAYIFTILNPLGMEESDLSSVSVYPNPTDGNLTISGDELFTELVLTDVSGKILDQTSLYPSGMISYSINQPEGVYFLKITAGKSSVVKKILVR